MAKLAKALSIDHSVPVERSIAGHRRQKKTPGPHSRKEGLPVRTDDLNPFPFRHASDDTFQLLIDHDRKFERRSSSAVSTRAARIFNVRSFQESMELARTNHITTPKISSPTAETAAYQRVSRRLIDSRFITFVPASTCIQLPARCGVILAGSQSVAWFAEHG